MAAINKTRIVKKLGEYLERIKGQARNGSIDIDPELAAWYCDLALKDAPSTIDWLNNDGAFDGRYSVNDIVYEGWKSQEGTVNPSLDDYYTEFFLNTKMPTKFVRRGADLSYISDKFVNILCDIYTDLFYQDQMMPTYESNVRVMASRMLSEKANDDHAKRFDGFLKELEKLSYKYKICIKPVAGTVDFADDQDSFVGYTPKGDDKIDVIWKD